MRGLGECNQTGVQQLAILKYDGGPNWPTRPSPTYNDTTDGVVSIKTCSALFILNKSLLSLRNKCSFNSIFNYYELL